MGPKDGQNSVLLAPLTPALARNRRGSDVPADRNTLPFALYYPTIEDWPFSIFFDEALDVEGYVRYLLKKSS